MFAVGSCLERRQESLHLALERWERLLNGAPNERILDLVVVPMRETVAKTDDPLHISDRGGHVRINRPQAAQRLTNDLQVALDGLPHLPLVEIRLERCTTRVLSDVVARPHNIFKQLR